MNNTSGRSENILKNPDGVGEPLDISIPLEKLISLSAVSGAERNYEWLTTYLILLATLHSSFHDLFYCKLKFKTEFYKNMRDLSKSINI